MFKLYKSYFKESILSYFGLPKVINYNKQVYEYKNIIVCFVAKDAMQFITPSWFEWQPILSEKEWVYCKTENWWLADKIKPFDIKASTQITTYIFIEDDQKYLYLGISEGRRSCCNQYQFNSIFTLKIFKLPKLLYEQLGGFRDWQLTVYEDKNTGFFSGSALEIFDDLIDYLQNKENIWMEVTRWEGDLLTIHLNFYYASIIYNKNKEIDAFKENIFYYSLNPFVDNQGKIKSEFFNEKYIIFNEEDHEYFTLLGSCCDLIEVSLKYTIYRSQSLKILNEYLITGQRSSNILWKKRVLYDSF